MITERSYDALASCKSAMGPSTMRLLLWTLMSVCLTHLVSGARILAFIPFDFTSHHILLEPWIRGLCERGHQVTYLSPYQFKGNIPNLEKISFPNFSIHEKLIESLKTSTGSVFDEVFGVRRAFFQLGNASMRSQEVTSVLQSNRQFDAVITETWFGQEYASVLSDRFNALQIVVQTFGGHSFCNEMSGLPDNPSYMYDMRYFKAEHPANLFERLYSLFTTATVVGVSYWFTQTKSQSLVDELVRYPGWENRQRLTMLASDAALVLRNTHFSLGFPSPSAPHVKDVGGLNVDFDVGKKPGLLDTPKYSKYKAFLDGSRDGFIYFSLGTIITPDLMLPRGTFEKLYGAFSKLKINVLMRWTGSDTPKTTSPNILLYNEFLPQMEILAYKNIKVFVTHGGFLSICESINFGVPLVGMPVFGDQPMNVKRVESHGYGLAVRIMNPYMTESLIATTVSKVLKNPSYKAEAMRRSELFRDRIMRPAEEAVYWTEYVLKHGKVLQPASARMPFYQVYLLDVLATIVVGLLVALYVTRKILCLVWSIIRGNKQQKTQGQLKTQATKKISKNE